MSAHGAGRSPTGAFAPTHESPAGGIPAWDAPDSARPAATTIAAGVRFTVAERQGDWARVICSNGWSAWVDGRRVVAVPSVEATARPSAAEGQPRQSLRGRVFVWLNSWQPPANWPPWLARAIGIGPLIGAGLGGRAAVPSVAPFGQSFKTGFLSLVVIGGRGALDPSLKPVWCNSTASLAVFVSARASSSRSGSRSRNSGRAPRETK